MIVAVVIGASIAVFIVVSSNRRRKRGYRCVKDNTIYSMIQASKANRGIIASTSVMNQSFEANRGIVTSTSVVRFLHSTHDFVPFNGPELVGSVQVVPCTNLGGVFRFNEHSIILKIPKDAVPYEVDLEVGVAIHGEFQFPKNKRPISAIFWLNVLEDFQFQKPIQIQLPHYLRLSKEEAESSTELGYLVATSAGGELNKNIPFHQGQTDQVDFYLRNGTIKTNRAGYMCLCASKSLIESRSEYFLVSAVPNPTPSLRWTIEFFVVYSLDTFVEVYVYIIILMHSIHIYIYIS